MSFALSFIASIYVFHDNSFAAVTLTPELDCAPASAGWLRVGHGFGQGEATAPARFQFSCQFASDWSPYHCITALDPGGRFHQHQLEISRNGYLGLYPPSERIKRWRVLQEPTSASASQLLTAKYGEHPDPLRRVDCAEETGLAADLLRISLSNGSGQQVDLRKRSVYLCSERVNTRKDPVPLFLRIETLS